MSRSITYLLPLLPRIWCTLQHSGSALLTAITQLLGNVIYKGNRERWRWTERQSDTAVENVWRMWWECLHSYFTLKLLNFLQTSSKFEHSSNVPIYFDLTFFKFGRHCNNLFFWVLYVLLWSLCDLSSSDINMLSSFCRIMLSLLLF